MVAPETKETSLTFQERHPILARVWRESWHFSKTQLITSGIIALVSIPINANLGVTPNILSFRSLVAAIIVYLGAVLLTVFVNGLRVPLRMLSEQHQDLIHLKARVNEINERQSVAGATKLPPSPPLPNPNLVYLSWEIIPAHIARDGSVAENQDNYADINGFALAVTFHNKPAASIPAGPIHDVSAQIVFSSDGQEHLKYPVGLGFWRK